MSDPKKILQSKFKQSCRYNNFGEVITWIQIKGFRCHQDTVINIESPITAFCGLNGTGKTTILQLIACAYYPIDEQDKRYYIKDFITVGILDAEPFKSNASFECRIVQENDFPESIKIYRRQDRRRWRYEKLKTKKIHFSKISSHLPRYEVNDFTIRQSHRLDLGSSNSLNQEIIKWCGRILGYSYRSAFYNQVSYSTAKNTYRSQVFTATKSGKDYSESNMGHGEGRIYNLIYEIENLPDKSLVLIEEPEISLHSSAQHEFGKYLIDVSLRKGHQIMITTHSEEILESLPSQSRVYLHRCNDGIRAILGLSSFQAKSLMTEGNKKALCIFIEDQCAESVLRSILRRIDSEFLKCVSFHQKGGHEEIKKLTKQLNDTELKVAAVLDGDVQPEFKNSIFTLPGSLPPEKEIFNNDQVKLFINSNYHVNFEDIYFKFKDQDHHDWFQKLSEYLCEDESVLINLLAKVYVNSLPENEITSLVNQLKEVL